jgi:hypothetical protein
MQRSESVVELPLELEALTPPVVSDVVPLEVGSGTPVEPVPLSEFDDVPVGTSVVLEEEPPGSVELPVVVGVVVDPCVPEELSVPIPLESPQLARAGATSEIPQNAQ